MDHLQLCKNYTILRSLKFNMSKMPGFPRTHSFTSSTPTPKLMPPPKNCPTVTGYSVRVAKWTIPVSPFTWLILLLSGCYAFSFRNVRFKFFTPIREAFLNECCCRECDHCWKILVTAQIIINNYNQMYYILQYGRILLNYYNKRVFATLSSLIVVNHINVSLINAS